MSVRVSHRGRGRASSCRCPSSPMARSATPRRHTSARPPATATEARPCAASARARQLSFVAPGRRGTGHPIPSRRCHSAAVSVVALPPLGCLRPVAIPGDRRSCLLSGAPFDRMSLGAAPAAFVDPSRFSFWRDWTHCRISAIISHYWKMYCADSSETLPSGTSSISILSSCHYSS